MKTALLLLVSALLCFHASAANWAVLVAGSDGFWNYRHQTDICHAYQILIKNGLKKEHIIVFSKNDVQTSSQNPFKGKLFNKPDPSGSGWDVNAGCNIDYQGGDVTPKNFLNVLKGNKTGVVQKVLETGKDDRVFIFYSDHGATGLIAFPSEYLYEKDLTPALKYMHDNNRYKELVFYLEACESGSMFQKLPENTKIYATSASSPYESSWAYYCPPDDAINGKHVGSCLGDEYSINWMEDSDVADMKTTTLDQQFRTVKEATKMSQVMAWGDKSFQSSPIGNFQSGNNNGQHAGLRTHHRVKEMKNFSFKLGGKMMDLALPVVDGGRGIDSRDVKLHYLMNKHNKENTLQSEAELKAELDSRAFFNDKFDAIKEVLNLNEEEIMFTGAPADGECLQRNVEFFEQNCAKFTDYSLKYVKVLAHICNKNVEQDLMEDIVLNLCQL
jgi:legumain